MSAQSEALASQAYLDDMTQKWAHEIGLAGGPYLVSGFDLYATFAEWLGEQHPDLRAKLLSAYPVRKWTAMMDREFPRLRRGRSRRKLVTFYTKYKIRPKRPVERALETCPECLHEHVVLREQAEPTAEELKAQLAALDLPPIREIKQEIQVGEAFPDPVVAEIIRQWDRSRRRS